MDDVAWGALAFALTVLGGIYTWYAYRRRGLAAGMRGASLTLLPVAAYLTKTLQMFGEIGDAIADWATSLVFSPQVWLGIVVAGVAAVLFVVSGWLGGRRDDTPKKVKGDAPRAVGGSAIVDDDMADIEAILRERGIT
ncbi:MAG TPA: hypothetical protein VFO49_21075 [Nocardioides sp.]|nr:hypothetical protein [Nocardioides sp.]